MLLILSGLWFIFLGLVGLFVRRRPLGRRGKAISDAGKRVLHLRVLDRLLPVASDQFYDALTKPLGAAVLMLGIVMLILGLVWR